MSPAEVLRAATIYPAEYFGRTVDLGTVTAGHLADLVVLDRNPLVNIRNTKSIYAVIANGRLFSAQDIVALERAQVRRLSAYRTTDLDQVIYMEVRRGGIARARLMFPDPLHDSAIVAKPGHLSRLVASLVSAGEANEARKALEWNLELFPGDTASRRQLDSLSAAKRRDATADLSFLMRTPHHR
jgi:hypothetical protein